MDRIRATLRRRVAALLDDGRASPAAAVFHERPVRVELMGHHTLEGVATALGGDILAIDTEEGSVVVRVGSPAWHSGRVLTPEEWGRLQSAREARAVERAASARLAAGATVEGYVQRRYEFREGTAHLSNGALLGTVPARGTASEVPPVGTRRAATLRRLQGPIGGLIEVVEWLGPAEPIEQARADVVDW